MYTPLALTTSCGASSIFATFPWIVVGIPADDQWLKLDTIEKGTGEATVVVVRLMCRYSLRSAFRPETGKSFKLLKLTYFRLCVQKHFVVHSIAYFIQVQYTGCSWIWTVSSLVSLFYIWCDSLSRDAYGGRRFPVLAQWMFKSTSNMRNPKSTCPFC